MFHLEKGVEERFSSFEKTLAFVSKEKTRMVRLPILGLWKEGARFHDDQRLGKGPNSFKFNNYGFTAICNMVGVSDLTLLKIQTPELASTVLNDLMSGTLVSNRSANNAEIVLDEDIGNVIGIVSKKYVGYSNDAFLRDVLTCLDEDNNGALFPTTGEFIFKEAYSINSRLFLRLTSKSVKGVISGRGGTGKDISEIGVEVSNSMAGGHAVRLSWFVFRLICANGLVAQVAGSQGRVVHSGTEEGFHKRLYDSTAGLFASLGKAKRMIETLASIRFDPVRLAKHADLKALFSIIPDRDLKEELLERTKSKDYSVLSKNDREIKRMSDAIAELPFCLGGREALRVFQSHWRDEASMYDFVNIFTEHAKGLPNGQKLNVESKAGSLASWIAENKRKFG
jgi:hypothetical protein